MEQKRKKQGFPFSTNDLPIALGPYTLLSRLGSSPIGEEFIAAWGVDEGVDQLRVLRLIYPELAKETEFVALFCEESRVLSRLVSSNIAKVMEVKIEGEISLIAREYIEGLTLSKLVKLAKQNSSLWPWEVAVFVVSEILKGLDYIHRRADIHGQPMGMRHGDLRPENILITITGDVKLFNFGSMLRYIADEATYSRIVRMWDSYRPPEGGDEYEPTVMSDLWATAMILLVVLGEKAPDSSSKQWVPPQMFNRVKGMPEVLDTFLARALNPEPEHRFQTASSMRSALVEILGEYTKGSVSDAFIEWVQKHGQPIVDEEQELIRDMMTREVFVKIGKPGGADELGPGFILDGRYEFIRFLGEGGMGSVYEAHHLGLDKRVAVKVLHERVMSEENTVERFKREAKIVAQLMHPNIVGALDFGLGEKGHYYLVMDLLKGKSMSSLIWEKDLNFREIIDIMIGVCDGLCAAHEKDIIHRDLKPENILVTEQGPKILDFGIAKVSSFEKETGKGLTQTGHICGTIDYIAPEQIRGVSDDKRSDLYAAGVILYESIVGVTPYEGKTIGEAMHNTVNMVLIPPSKQKKRLPIPEGLEAVCLGALEREAENRIKSSIEMRDALKVVKQKLEESQSEIAELMPGHFPIDRLEEETKKVMSFWKKLLITTIIILGLIITGTALLFNNGQVDIEKLEKNLEPIEKVTQAVLSKSSGANQNSDNTLVIADPQVQEHPAIDETSEKNQLEAENTIETSTEADVKQAENIALAKKQVELGNNLLSKRIFDKAEDAFIEATKLNHRDSNAWYGAGRAAYGNGNYTNAAQNIERAIRYNPGQEIIVRRNFLGVVYQAMGENEKAISQWNMVLQRQPDNHIAKQHLERAGANQD